MESLKIQMKAPNNGGFTHAKNIEHANRMIQMFGYEVADERYTQQGKQCKPKKKKKKDIEGAD